MSKEDEAKQYLRTYFAQADKINRTITEMDQLRKQDSLDQEKLSKKVKEYESMLDTLNSGKEKMDQSLKELGFDKPIAKFDQEELIRLSEILEP